eukprot:352853-Chlamydomonas_euryale.AAC.1
MLRPTPTPMLPLQARSVACAAARVAVRHVPDHGRGRGALLLPQHGAPVRVAEAVASCRGSYAARVWERRNRRFHAGARTGAHDVLRSATRGLRSRRWQPCAGGSPALARCAHSIKSFVPRACSMQRTDDISREMLLGAQAA